MTRQETKILGRLLTILRQDSPHYWSELKYQTQYGPEFSEFPYFPAALELAPLADRLIRKLSVKDRNMLVEQWKSKPRLIDLDNNDEIMAQYGAILLDYVVETARWAGARTDFDR